MIVKSYRWKSADFSKLIRYIDKEKAKTFSLYHNIRDKSPEGAIREFKENDSFRNRRKNGVAIYHEIISFNEKDSEHLSVEKMEDIARKYCGIRGERALCFAKAHFDRKHFHIHFAFSGTEYKNKRTLRLDNKAFRKVRRQIESYQLQQYPELKHSIVYHGNRKKKKKESDREYRHKQRSKKETDKDFVRDSMEKAFRECKDFETFLDFLKREGFEVYYYRDKPNGILYNKRKFRFGSLGFGKGRFEDRKKKLEILDRHREVLRIKRLEQNLRNITSSAVNHSRDHASDVISNREVSIQLKKFELRKIQRIHFQRQFRR